MTKENLVTYTEKQIGRHDDYHFELWKDSGDTTMTLNAGGTFTCSWSDVNNALFRKGRKYWQERPYEEIGNISIEYGVDYRPEGNSYLCVYGWTRAPLVEYYIVESWGTWRPPGEDPKGQITVDGATYDVYVTTRENQPSIDGTTTFKQYWSVRTSKSCSGKVSLNEHFKAWEAMGMPMGKLHEASLTIEGYQSCGYADVYRNELTITPKQVALTFDDGPAITTTPQMLDILEEHHEVATFFLVGSNINEDTREIMKRQLAMGCELANHSFTHSHLNQLTAQEIQQEVEQTNAAIKAAVGVEPQFFRPPYIAVNELMHETIHMPFIHGIMCDDWKPEVSPQERTRMILDRVQDGTIILIHDTEGNEGSVAALPDILAGLKQNGYQLVTLSQLFKSKGVDPEQKYHIWTHVK